MNVFLTLFNLTYRSPQRSSGTAVTDVAYCYSPGCCRELIEM
jgi:hypothetical protein